MKRTAYATPGDDSRIYESIDFSTFTISFQIVCQVTGCFGGCSAFFLSRYSYGSSILGCDTIGIALSHTKFHRLTKVVIGYRYRCLAIIDISKNKPIGAYLPKSIRTSSARFPANLNTGGCYFLYES